LFVERIPRSAVQKLDHQGNDLGEVFGLALVFILIRLQTSFDVNQASFSQIFLADLSKSPPGFDVDPFGIFLGLTLSVLPAFADSNTKMGDFPSCGSVLAFRTFS